MPRIRFLVTGPRVWENKAPIYKVLNRLAGNYGIARLLMIEGGCTGVDQIARDTAAEVGIHTVELKPLWDIHNHAAGPIRNGVMFELEPRFVVAFHYYQLKDHRGTADAVRRARAADIPVKLIRVHVDVALPSSVAPESPEAKRRVRAAKRATRGNGKR